MMLFKPFIKQGKQVRISYSSYRNPIRQLQQDTPFELFLSAKISTDQSIFRMIQAANMLTYRRDHLSNGNKENAPQGNIINSLANMQVQNRQ